MLAEWEKEGLIDGIVTQNVDGFHHDAGSENVMEIHGTFRSLYCHDCGKEQDHDAYREGAVHCSCGGPIRPGIVLLDRKSTRLNSSHVAISYAVFCLKKKTDTAGTHQV